MEPKTKVKKKKEPPVKRITKAVSTLTEVPLDDTRKLSYFISEGDGRITKNELWQLIFHFLSITKDVDMLKLFSMLFELSKVKGN